MAKFCVKCGKKLEDDYAVCPDCGTFCNDGTKAAPTAAQQQAAPTASPIVVNEQNNQPSGKKIDKWVAFLLCFFLGTLGAHKFFEGKMGLGILYLFTGGLFGIGVLIDFITILMKPDPYYV